MPRLLGFLGLIIIAAALIVGSILNERGGVALAVAAFACVTLLSLKHASQLLWFVLLLILFSDYSSLIFELRMAEEALPSIWTVRPLWGIPIADWFVSFALLVLGIRRWRQRASSPDSSLPLDKYVIGIACVVAYGAAIGLLTWTPNDVFREFLYEVRVWLWAFAFYWMLSRLLDRDISVERFFLASIWVIGILSLYSFAKVQVAKRVFGMHLYEAFEGEFLMSDAWHLNFYSLFVISAVILPFGGLVSRWKSLVLFLWANGIMLVMLFSARRGNVLIAIAGVVICGVIALRDGSRWRLWRAGIIGIVLLAIALSGNDIAWISRVLISVVDFKDATYDRYAASLNVFANLERQGSYLQGFGLGRRWEEIYPIPVLGGGELAFAEDELRSTWKFSHHTLLLPYLFKFGVIGSGVLVLIVSFLVIRELAHLRYWDVAERAIAAIALFNFLWALQGTQGIKNSPLLAATLAILGALDRRARVRRNSVEGSRLEVSAANV